MSEDTDLTTDLDSPETLRTFFQQVKDRAEALPKNCIEHTNPDVAAKCLWMLAQGKSPTEVRRVTGVGHEAVRRLSWDHKATLDDYRPLFAQRYAMAAAEMTDLIFKKAEQLHDDEEALKATPIDRLAVAAGIVQDHSNKLAGMATTVVEHRKGVSMEDAMEEIKRARKAASIDVEVIEQE